MGGTASEKNGRGSGGGVVEQDTSRGIGVIGVIGIIGKVCGNKETTSGKTNTKLGKGVEMGSGRNNVGKPDLGIGEKRRRKNDLVKPSTTRRL